MNADNTRLSGWIKYIVLILLSGFFLLFGVQVLLAAYQLKDPFSFIMTFFASNFIILISLTLVIVFVCQVKAFVVVSRHSEQQDILDGEKSEEDR